MARRRLEQQRGAARTQHAVGQFGHFEDGGNGLPDAAQFAERFEASGEIAQVFVFHPSNFIDEREDAARGWLRARRLSILPALMSVRSQTFSEFRYKSARARASGTLNGVHYNCK
jgi:hypothetical protein